MRARFVTVLMLSLAATGCATAKRSPDARLPGGYEAPQPGAAAVALDQWWTAFGDAQLTALVESAFARNPDAKSAAARLAEARAARSQALFGFLPQGNLTGSGRKTHTEQLSGTVINIPGFSSSGDSEAYAANFNVSWEVDLFGRIFAANRAASADVAAARFDYEATRAALAAQVADAYFQARGLAIQLDDARETVTIDQGLYDVAAKRAERGLAASSEADRVAGDLASAKAQAANFEAELQAQKRTLLILAGRTIEPTADVDAPPNVGAAPPVPATLPSQLLERRPDVREAEARLAGALGRVDVARLAFLPTFTLTPGLGWAKQVQPNFSSETSSWTIGGAFSQPILNIPTLLEQLHVQNARADQAAAAYEKAVQTAFGEAEAALVRLDAAKRRVALLADGEARARRAYEASRTGYDHGLVDLQTTLSSRQSWRLVRAQLTSAEVQALRQTIQAYKAIGGGWPGATTIATAQAR
jgi:NodT family efflux transporter outer membrane factor (OMF) lipoprotein